MGELLGGEDVGRFARLAEHQREHVFVDQRIAVAELAAVLDFDMDPRQALDHALGGQARVPRTAAADGGEMADGAQFADGHPEFVQENLAGRLVQAAQGRFPDGPRLLEDFLQHEMLVAALLGHQRIPLDVMHGPPDRPGVRVQHPDAASRQDGDVAVFELDHVPGPVQDGGDARGQEILALAQADDRRQPAARRDDLAGFLLGDGREAAGPLDFARDQPHRFLQRRAAVGLAADQRGQDLLVGSLGSRPTAQPELQPEVPEIAGAPVQGHRHAAASGTRRLAGETLGGPARVANAVGAADRIEPDGRLEIP